MWLASIAIVAAWFVVLLTGWGRGGEDMTMDWIIKADPRPGIQ